MRSRLALFSFAMSAALAATGCAGGMGGPMHGMSGMGAQNGGHMMMAMGPLIGCPGQHGDVDARVSSLHASLNISAPQEAAWSAYADAYRRHARDMGMGAMQHHTGPSAAPDRLGRHVEMMETHLASMRALRDALAGLYAVLTPEQRSAADALVCEGMHRGR